MGRAGLIGAGSAGAVVLVLVLAQVFLPGIAADRVSSRVGRYGTVESVSVKAWPAVELLWGRVDSVKVRAKSLRLSPAQAAGLVWEARGTDSVDLTAEGVQVGPLRLTNASLSKRGSALSGEGLASEADVRAALPAGIGVQLVKSEGGQVEVQASGGLFGVSASVNAVAEAREGRLVAHPLGFLLEGFQLTLFSDPHVYVRGVGASVEGQRPLSYRLTISASLR
ncbi:MAG TPA: LmeA family phospholipid-binding protein [Solirubrobacteraceae bacterium]|nr:LmeA family phospholipid-binding protein [Solirubrobacteraceae bacterium]